MKKTLLTLACVALAAMAVDAKTIFVKIGGTGDGSSWDKAYGSLNDAVTASVEKDEIWVGPGLFIVEKKVEGNKNGLILPPTVSIYGGFAGTESAISERQKGDSSFPWDFVNVTEIKGVDNDIRLIQCHNAGNNTALPYADRPRWEPGIFDGLKITHVNTGGNRVMWSREASIMWQNCQFIGMKDGTSCLYFEDAKGGVKDCYFEGCQNAILAQTVVTASGYGATTVIENNVFAKTVGSNAVIRVTSVPGDSGLETPAVVISKNMFIDNAIEVAPGGGPSATCLYVMQSDPVRSVNIHNNVFVGNQFTGYGASVIVKTNAGLMNFNNNVVSNNTSIAHEGQAGYCATIATHVPGKDDAHLFFQNLVVNNTAPSCFSIQGSNLFNNTIANNIGLVTFSNYCMVFNNIISNNQVDRIDTAPRVQLGVFSVVQANLLSQDFEFTGDGSIEDEISIADNILATKSIFVKPTSTVGVTSEDIDADGFSPLETSEAIAAGTIEPFGYFTGTDVFAYINAAGDLSGAEYNVEDPTLTIGALQGTATSSLSKVEKETLKTYAVDGGFSLQADASTVVSVFSLSGQLVKSVIVPEGLNTIAISEGTYIVKASNSSSSVASKVSVR